MNKNPLSIKKWDMKDRPREKMLQNGINTLSDAELLAILLGSGNKEESAVQLAQRILLFADNKLNELGKKGVKELIAKFKGIGEAKAITICAALELGKRRKVESSVERKIIHSSSDVFEVFYPILSDLPYEELWVLFTSTSGKVIEKIKISQGGKNETSADIQIILKAAILSLAYGVILCHNHPSGNITPSNQDDILTNKMKEAVNLIGIKLLDHIVLSDTKYYSYADEGRL